MDPVEVVLSYLAAFDTADPELIASHVTEDFRNEHVSALGSSSAGRVEYGSRLPGFLASFEELHYEIEDALSEGSRVVVAYRMTARHRSIPIALRGMFRFEVRDSLIAHRIDYFDSKTFLDQTEGG